MNKRNIVSILLFVSLVIVIGSFLTKVFNRKSDLEIWNDFYNQPKESIDIIIMGSSLTEMAINPYQLGMSTDSSVYNFSVSAQTTPARTYFLKEILKTQSPKMIVMETYRYMQNPGMAIDEILYSMSGMKWSWNKLQMMLEIPIRDEYADHRMEIILPLLAGHNRWTDLQADDFLNLDGTMPNVRRGSSYGVVNIEPQSQLVVPTKETDGIPDMQEPYIEEIITLCKENDITLLFFNTPNPEYDENALKGYNALYEYLGSQNVDYLDCNYEEAIRAWIDTTTDFCDYHHTNTVGQYKTTKFLADYINEKYPNLGTNTVVLEQFEAYMNQKLQKIRKCSGTKDYIMYMYNDELDYYMELSNEHHDETVRKLLNGVTYQELAIEMQGMFDSSLDYSMKIVAVNKEDGRIADVAYVLSGNESIVIHQNN